MRAIGLACLLLLCGAGPTSADALVDCNQGRNAELRLQACSQIIAGAHYSPEQKAFAYRNRGNARADAGASSQALADLNEAIRLNPNEVSGFAGRARARLALRDLDGAIADYSKALQLMPATASLHVGRGHAHFVRGDTTAAIADFTEAIKLNPQSASTFNRRGLTFRRSGDLARAIEDYTSAITINPVYAHNDQGQACRAPRRCWHWRYPQGAHLRAEGLFWLPQRP